MADEIKPGTASASPTPSQPTQPQDRGIGHLSMSEEMDSARWTLPPIVPILAGLAAVVIVVGIVSVVFRAKPTASGSIEKVIAAQQESNVLVAIHVKFNNLTDETLHIKGLTADLETEDGQKHTDVAAAAADIDRYFQAFPELGEGRTTPLREELTIPKKTSQSGMAIFSYPVDKATFEKRKSLAMKIDFYDHTPLVVH
jgi:hypothetical protein